MEQTMTGIATQEPPVHPRPAAATVADVMRPPRTTVGQHDPGMAYAVTLKRAQHRRTFSSRACGPLV
jgi:hypothetical protein